MNVYKKFVCITFVAAFVFTAAYGGFSYLFFQTPVGKSTEKVWINKCILKKEAIAQSITGPKIIFIGGSATLYGIRAADVQARYGVPAVNVAVHAALMTDYLLYLASRVASSGDTVIFPAEYEQFNYDGEYNQVRSFYLRTFDSGYFMGQPLRTILFDLYNTTPKDFLYNAKSSIDFAIAYKGKEPPVGTELTSETLNANGDETYNIGNEKMTSVMKNISPFGLNAIKVGGTKGLADIKRFAAWCKQNNIRFYVSYANTARIDTYDSDIYRRYYVTLADYFAKNNISVIGKPSDFFYDSNLFYNTRYHLNQDGVTIRTRQFMKMMEDMKLVSPPRGAAAL